MLLLLLQKQRTLIIGNKLIFFMSSTKTISLNVSNGFKDAKYTEICSIQ